MYFHTEVGMKVNMSAVCDKELTYLVKVQNISLLEK
jgi:hypothetical protein